MAAIHGVRSFEGLRARADTIDLGSTSINRGRAGGYHQEKKAARRPRDRAVLEVLEKALEEKEQKGTTRRRPLRE